MQWRDIVTQRVIVEPLCRHNVSPLYGVHVTFFPRKKVTKEVFVEIETLHRSSFRTLFQAISVPGNEAVNTEIAIRSC